MRFALCRHERAVQDVEHRLEMMGGEIELYQLHHLSRDELDLLVWQEMTDPVVPQPAHVQVAA